MGLELDRHLRFALCQVGWDVVCHIHELTRFGCTEFLRGDLAAVDEDIERPIVRVAAVGSKY